MDSNKLRRLAGIPIDLSKVDNALATVRTPTRPLTCSLPHSFFRYVVRICWSSRHAHGAGARQRPGHLRDSCRGEPAQTWVPPLGFTARQLVFVGISTDPSLNFLE